MTERILQPDATGCGSRWSGKYTDLHDAYKSVQEALIHGGIANDARVEIEWIASDRFTDQAAAGRLLAGFDGLLVPGGFGERGVEGMIEAIRWARENDLPFFGICLGLQVAIIEFARNVCRLPDTNSTEFEPDCETPGDRADAVAARRERPGRHHAARRLHRPAPARLARGAGLRHRPRSASGTGTAGR